MAHTFYSYMAEDENECYGASMYVWNVDTHMWMDVIIYMRVARSFEAITKTLYTLNAEIIMFCMHVVLHGRPSHHHTVIRQSFYLSRFAHTHFSRRRRVCMFHSM